MLVTGSYAQSAGIVITKPTWFGSCERERERERGGGGQGGVKGGGGGKELVISV